MQRELGITAGQIPQGDEVQVGAVSQRSGFSRPLRSMVTSGTAAIPMSSFSVCTMPLESILMTGPRVDQGDGRYWGDPSASRPRIGGQCQGVHVTLGVKLPNGHGLKFPTQR